MKKISSIFKNFLRMFLYFYKNFFHKKKKEGKMKKYLFECSSFSLFNPALRVFLRVLGWNPRKRGVFIGLKVETHKTTSFWLLEAQNDLVLEVLF